MTIGQKVLMGSGIVSVVAGVVLVVASFVKEASLAQGIFFLAAGVPMIVMSRRDEG